MFHEDMQSHIGIAVKTNDKSGFYRAKSFKNKSLIPLCSSAAELGAAVECTKDVYSDRAQLEEWGFKQKGPTVIMEDNQPLINVTRDYSSSSRRMRQYIQYIGFMLQSTKEGVVRLEHIKGTDQIVDPLTKIVGPKAHWDKLAAMVGEHPNVEEARQRAGQTWEQQRVKEEKRTQRRAYASSIECESEEERRLEEAAVNRVLNASLSQDDTTAEERHSDQRGGRDTVQVITADDRHSDQDKHSDRVKERDMNDGGERQERLDREKELRDILIQHQKRRAEEENDNNGHGRNGRKRTKRNGSQRRKS
jgi:hypothetical protein